ncbi:DNA adenine methylase [Coraliomargarita algicola]|uniref:site-specific DNA-methyltransferase (adenine-specific) n=1 Tax=Coraliomargarita algicola TaxID=3092156 RepID=A0ABZ0RGE4_9BACT|nr:DNA adenine methylase [Coraliomargarita sp. J2-16]WPJ95235.1 DNA adenine methylase [Coraliomargarita sp. J2-16]
MSIAHSPLRYPGGKNCIFSFVSCLIAENDMLGCKYIEPYAGGAGLALRLLYEEFAESIVINDLDPLVHAFWCTCVNEPGKLIEWIKETPVTVSIWKQCKEIIRNPEGASPFEMAVSFFFLNRTNVSGVLSGGIIGGVNQTGKYKIDARYNKAALIQKIEKIGRFSSRIEVSKLDGIKLVEKYKKYRADTFLYLDPPYYEKGSNLYLNAYKDADHTRLSEYVSTLSTPWLLSYDNHSFIIDLYNAFEKRAYKLQHSTSNKIGDEVLIFSRKISFDKSLAMLREPLII